MFTENDYVEYFGQIEESLKRLITIYTDILNETSDNAIKCKLDPLATETMEAFRFIKEKRSKFQKPGS